jgi:2-C-methyl-D-erythritol 2,4-cyclodiphosphate synthase
VVGIGYDMHRLEEGESLILAGIKLESSKGTVAHSDGDVLLHSVIDALLGATGKGDIGDYFPDTDPKWKNADSVLLTKEIIKIIEKDNYLIVNIDLTIVTEKPKISPHKQILKDNLAKICNISPTQVNIKATTNEKRGFVGREEGIVVLSVCQVEKSNLIKS